MRRREYCSGSAKACCASALLMAQLLPVTAQDVRGLEVCTTEKQMERRTGCLQANVDFLQQALTKLTRETQDRMSALEATIEKAAFDGGFLLQMLISGFGTKQTSQLRLAMSAFGDKADIGLASLNVRFTLAAVRRAVAVNKAGSLCCARDPALARLASCAPNKNEWVVRAQAGLATVKS